MRAFIGHKMLIHSISTRLYTRGYNNKVYTLQCYKNGAKRGPELSHYLAAMPLLYELFKLPVG
jgi:hypothetical protein